VRHRANQQRESSISPKFAHRAQKLEHRLGINVGYTLSWLRQEENQYLACPLEVARTLPIDLAKLMGYRRGAYALGYFGDTQDPLEALHGKPESRGFKS
jgi:hypothetical protein